MTNRKIMKYILTCLLLVLSLHFGSCNAEEGPKKSENAVNTNSVSGTENVNKVKDTVDKPIVDTNSQNENVNKDKNLTKEKNVGSETGKKITNVPSTPNPINLTKDNVTKPLDVGLFQKIKDNKDMLTRTFYVMLGVTSIVVIYFVVRAWRSKRRQNKSRKYGLLASSGADLEMEPLDRDVDDDDEMTMFERQK